MAEKLLTIQTVACEISNNQKATVLMVKKFFCHQIVTLIGHFSMKKKSVSYQDRIYEWIRIPSS